LKIIEVAHKFWAIVLHGTSNIFILTKIGLAIFWANFSQTHLVTLHDKVFVAHISVLLLYTLRVKCFFGKNWFGYILGEFFTNSSGHPA
jgi:hypothetical protein